LSPAGRRDSFEDEKEKKKKEDKESRR